MPCGVFDAAVALICAAEVLSPATELPHSVGGPVSGLMLILCVGCHRKRTSWIACLAPVFSCRIVLKRKMHYSTRAHCSESTHLVCPQALQNNTVCRTAPDFSGKKSPLCTVYSCRS